MIKLDTVFDDTTGFIIKELQKDYPQYSLLDFDSYRCGISDTNYYYAFEKKNKLPVDIIDRIFYRGYIIDILLDDPGQQYYTIIDDMTYSFGAYNFNYMDDIFYIIDDRLDTIYTFDGTYLGAQLKFIKKAISRDIILTYRLRDLKIFLTPDNYKLTEIDKQELIDKSKIILINYLKEKELNKIIDL